MMDNFDLEAFAKEVNQLAHEKGWYDPSPPMICEREACIHCEWSEALQAYRNGEPVETIATELVDGVLRLLEWAAERDELSYTARRVKTEWSLYELNAEQWNEIVFPGLVAVLHDQISRGSYDDCVCDVICWVRAQGLDPFKLMREKHEYNKTRPYRHGNKRC